MEAKLQSILDQQKQVWDKFSPGWKRWDKFLQDFLHPIGTAIIDELHIEKTDRVLDVATGTGYPGITIAQMVSEGEVIGTDISDQMLNTARENAAALALMNFEVQVADVEDLPFPGEEFDAVSCRMGFMFFPDMQLSADEMHRVLKVGGRVSASVFSTAAKNNWIALPISIIAKHVEMPPADPGMPGMFRCSAPGLMTGIFEYAGFKKVSERELRGKVSFESPDDYFQCLMEVTPLIAMVMNKADEETKSRIKEELFAAVNQFRRGDQLMLDYAALVISGEK